MDLKGKKKYLDFSFFQAGRYVASARDVGAVVQSHCDLPEERKF